MPSIFELIPGFKKKRVKIGIPGKDSKNRSITSDDKLDMITLLEIEATLKETHTFSTTLSENPIENGSYVTDHANIQPVELQLTCMISNNPLSFKQAIIGNASGLMGSIIGRATQNNLISAIATGAFSSIGTKIANMITNQKNAVADAMQKLLSAWEGATPLSVESGLRSYTNMVITNMSFNKDKDTAEVLSFQMTLREIRVVLSRTTIQKGSLRKTVQHTAATAAQNGKMPLKKPTDQQKSALGNLADGMSFPKTIVEGARSFFK